MTGPPLEPVRAEMLRQARADAAAAVAQAEAEAADQIARARAEAAAILTAAGERGEADAARALHTEAARAGREARALDLRVRREVFESWRQAVFDGIRALRKSAEYPRILDRLAEQAHDLLGAAAEIEREPAGGLRARADGRRVDLTLEGIAARAVEDAAGEAGELWTT